MENTEDVVTVLVGGEFGDVATSVLNRTDDDDADETVAVRWCERSGRWLGLRSGSANAFLFRMRSVTDDG